MMRPKSVGCGVLAGLVLCLFSILSAPSDVGADGGAATFFLARQDTGAEVTASAPLAMNGASPITFDLRVRDAGSMAKAGWQATLLIDACEFQTPAGSAIVLSDMFSNVIPLRKVTLLENDTIQIMLGQVMLGGSTTADAGKLASMTLTPKAARSCAAGGSELAQMRFSGAPLTQWLAPGGASLPLQTRPGYVKRGPAAVTLSQFAATSGESAWPLMVAISFAVLLGAAGCIRLFAHRSQP